MLPKATKGTGGPHERWAEASEPGWKEQLPPVMPTFVGRAAGSTLDEEGYRRYLNEKHHASLLLLGAAAHLPVHAHAPAPPCILIGALPASHICGRFFVPRDPP